MRLHPKTLQGMRNVEHRLVDEEGTCDIIHKGLTNTQFGTARSSESTTSNIKVRLQPYKERVMKSYDVSVDKLRFIAFFNYEDVMDNNDICKIRNSDVIHVTTPALGYFEVDQSHGITTGDRAFVSILLTQRQES